MKTKCILLTIFVFSSIAAFCNEFVGLWTTIDDETQEKKSVVRIYKSNNQYYGRVVHLFKNPDSTAKLSGNPKILGLDIIWDMTKKDTRLKGGKILDPKKGSVYSCEMWRDGKNLIVRGKIAFLGRNQTWVPYKGTEISLTTEELVPNILAK